MIVARTIGEIRSAVAEARRAGAAAVGLVPTMGALHEGHYSLIEAARGECDFVVVSIFVNPTQFGLGEDYLQYPRALPGDLAGCESRGVGAVFAPEAKEMYPGVPTTTVHVGALSEVLCGAHRPGHFDGVCTVVAKLFGAAAPDAAWFGRKDYQQLVVIRRMVADLNLPVRIEEVPIVREPDGLAMSSRNGRLTPQERSQAPALSRALREAQGRVAQGAQEARKVAGEIRAGIEKWAPLGDIDYVEIVDPATLGGVVTVTRPAVAAVAVRFPSARLIDNVLLAPPGR
jgi:pantoate--beta-alanine ligase